MKHERLASLADGIFAIVMTILVFQIEIPHLPKNISSYGLARVIFDMYPLFLSYLLSFSLLFTYWRSHHFIVSVFAKAVDVTLTNINAIFFFFIGLVPFSSHLLGQYSTVQTSIIFFSANVILIGVSLFIMRRYIKHSKSIENAETTVVEEQHAYARILFPVLCAIGAIVISFWSKQLSLVFLTLGILFNLMPASTRITFAIWNTIIGKTDPIGQRV